MMATTDLHHETATTIQEWRSGLGLMVTTRLYENHPDLRRRFGEAGRIVFRQTVETLLAHLESATLRGRPELFADYVTDDDAVPANIGLNAADLGTTLEQMRDTLRHHLPGPRGELAYEYVELGLARLPRQSRRTARAKSPAPALAVEI
jgi:hypothetical protein